MKRNILASFLLFAMALVGCTSYDEPDRAKDIAKDAETVYLSLDASLSSPTQSDGANNSTRRVSWKPIPVNSSTSSNATANIGWSGTDYPAIIVIKNLPAQGAQEKLYYLSSTFRLDGDLLTLRESNPEGLSNVLLDKDIYSTEIKLNRSEQWYMMAYFGENWDQANKRMSYEPHRNRHWSDTYGRGKLLAPVRDSGGASVTGIEQPMILPWVKMTLKNSAEGKLIFSPEDENTNRSVKAMGTFIVPNLRNTSGSRKTVLNVKLYSNVLSTKGYYSLANQDLPAIASPDALVDPIWFPEDLQANGFYDNGYLELVKWGRRFPIININHNQTLNGHYHILWGMPMSLSDASLSPSTQILAKVSNSANGNQSYETSIWSSTNQPKQFISLAVSGTITR